MQRYCSWRGFSACLSITTVLLWSKFNVNRWSTDVTEQRWLGLKGWEPPCFAMRLLGLGLQSSRIASSLQSGARAARLTWSLVNSVSYSFSMYRRAFGLCILSAAVRWSGLLFFFFFFFLLSHIVCVFRHILLLLKDRASALDGKLSCIW